MEDIPMILIGIFISFFLTLGISIYFTSTQEELNDNRVALNAVCDYVDIITDSARLNGTDYSEFLAQLHTTGKKYEVVIKREKRVVFNRNGEVTSEWFQSELFDNSTPIVQTYNLNKGDRIIISAQEKSSSIAGLILKNVFNVKTGTTKITIPGVVRNG